MFVSKSLEKKITENQIKFRIKIRQLHGESGFTNEKNGCTLYKNRKQNKRYKEKGIAYEGTKKSGMSRTAGNV